MARSGYACWSGRVTEQAPAELAVLHEHGDVVDIEVGGANRRATVDHDRLAGDESAEVAQDEHHGTGELLRRSPPLEGEDSVASLVGGIVASAVRRADRARRDGVHADAVTAPFDGHRPR